MFYSNYALYGGSIYIKDSIVFIRGACTFTESHSIIKGGTFMVTRELGSLATDKIYILSID